MPEIKVPINRQRVEQFVEQAKLLNKYRNATLVCQKYLDGDLIDNAALKNHVTVAKLHEIYHKVTNEDITLTTAKGLKALYDYFMEGGQRGFKK